MISHHFLYLWVDIGCFLFPFLLSFHPHIQFYKAFKTYFAANLIAAGVFILWDILYTKMGVWNFNPYYVTGIYFFNLPIEEVMFFFCIPFACSFSYYVFEKQEWFYSKSIYAHLHPFLLLLFVASALIFHEKLYTFGTSLINIGLLWYLRTQKNLFSKITQVYLWMLIPFFISNGILTGAITPAPIVGYNDAENLGIRMITIPMEDIFYGFALFALTICLFEKFRSNDHSM